MNNYIKIGIGVMILDGNKILLGHRAKNKKDTKKNIQKTNKINSSSSNENYFRNKKPQSYVLWGFLLNWNNYWLF